MRYFGTLNQLGNGFEGVNLDIFLYTASGRGFYPLGFPSNPWPNGTCISYYYCGKWTLWFQTTLRSLVWGGVLDIGHILGAILGIVWTHLGLRISPIPHIKGVKWAALRSIQSSFSIHNVDLVVVTSFRYTQCLTDTALSSFLSLFRTVLTLPVQRFFDSTILFNNSIRQSWLITAFLLLF